jgi:hypothetical protein
MGILMDTDTATRVTIPTDIIGRWFTLGQASIGTTAIASITHGTTGIITATTGTKKRLAA